MKWIKFYEAFRPSGGVLPVRELEVEDFKKLLSENCTDFMEILKSVDYNLVGEKQKFLFRKSPDIGEMVYSNPGSAGHERIAPYSPVGNYHNLIISNLESWKEYPKRNKSICTGRFSRIEIAHGKEIYLVIPYDKTRIGIAPSMDMWFAFKKLTKYKVSTGNPKFDYETPGLIIDWFKNIIEVVSKKAGSQISDVSWTDLKTHLDQKYTEFAKVKYQSQPVSKKVEAPKYSYFPEYDRNQTLLNNLQRILDPNLHGFSIGYMKDLPNIFKDKSVECWFSEDCLMIKWNLLKDKGPEEIRSMFE
jgi:hypothetical protein